MSKTVNVIESISAECENKEVAFEANEKMHGQP